MGDLQKAGKIRALGTSNFEIPHLKELMAVPGGAPVAVNQMNFHVGYHDDFLSPLLSLSLPFLSPEVSPSSITIH